MGNTLRGRLRFGCVRGERAAGREFRTHMGRDIVEAGEGAAGPAGSCLLHRETPRRLAGGLAVFLQPAAHQETAVGLHPLLSSDFAAVCRHVCPLSTLLIDGIPGVRSINDHV